MDDSLIHKQKEGIEFKQKILDLIDIAVLTTHYLKLKNKAMIMLMCN